MLLPCVGENPRKKKTISIESEEHKMFVTLWITSKLCKEINRIGMPHEIINSLPGDWLFPFTIITALT